MSTKAKLLQFYITYYKNGFCPTDKILPNDGNDNTLNRERLHRWIDILIDSGQVDKIDINWYDAGTGYVPKYQQKILNREVELDNMEGIN
jgi:hypothetical protein